ncbi:MAG: SsrA-binding protein [Lachnospiraceae bacterium]
MKKGNIFNKDPLRGKKASDAPAMRSTNSWGRSRKKALRLFPLKVYFKGSLRSKVEIGLMQQDKKLYDKREDLAKKDQRREAEKEFKIRNLR